VLLNERGVAAAVRRRIERVDASLHVPQLFEIEVLQAVRGHLRGGRLTLGAADAAVRALGDLRAERWSHERLRRRIWQLRDNLTAYDATYIALAEYLDLPLVTLDAKLAAVAPATATVELLIADA